MHWLAHVLGLDDAAGGWYLWWSGFASDLAEFAAGASIAGAYLHHHNCHVRGCWRPGHPDDDGEVRCRRHLANVAETR
jgi:hypothetical protein